MNHSLSLKNYDSLAVKKELWRLQNYSALPRIIFTRIAMMARTSSAWIKPPAE
jgi:hypothetical protein